MRALSGGCSSLLTVPLLLFCCAVVSLARGFGSFDVVRVRRRRLIVFGRRGVHGLWRRDAAGYFGNRDRDSACELRRSKLVLE